MKFHYSGHPRNLDEDNGMPNDTEIEEYTKNLELVEMIVEKSLDFEIGLNIIDKYMPNRNIVFHFAFENG